MSDWSVPAGNQVGFDLKQPWSVPPGNQVGFNFSAEVRNVFADGWESVVFGMAVITADTTIEVSDAGAIDSLEIGAHHIKPEAVALAPFGFNSLQHGAAQVRNQREFVNPSGWLSQLFGNARLSLRTIFPTGIAPGLVGTHWISILDRTLRPGGYFDERFGSAQFAGGVRWIELNSRGVDPGPFGTAFVARRSREVFPFGFQATFYGAPMIGYHRDIEPAGFDAQAFGQHDIKDNRQITYPSGMSGDTGMPFVDYGTRSLFPRPIWEADEWRFGRPDLINLLQFINASYIESQWNLGAVGRPHAYNRNRTVDLVLNGIAPPFRQIPLDHDIYNKARLLRPAGIDAFASTGNMVAHAIRYLEPPGYHRNVSITGYHVVYNDARIVSAIGFDALAMTFGHWLENTRRWFPHIGAGAQDSYGTPFIAFAERTITQDRPFQRFPMPAPTVWFASRVIQQLPPDFPGAAFGVHTLDIRFTRIKPMSIASTLRFGTETKVRNVTPEVRPYSPGNGWSVWGQARVFLQYDFYPVQGFTATEFGNHFIRDRRTWVHPPGIDSFRDNKLHHIFNNTPDPPGRQYIVGASLGVTGSLTAPSLNYRSIFPLGIDSAAYGSADVRINGIEPGSILPPMDGAGETNFGMPSLNRPIRIHVIEGIHDEDVPKVVLNPRTIWAPTGAPPQAVANHPGLLTYPIDGLISLNMPVFGSPTISNKHRVIFVTDTFAMRGAVGMPATHRRPEFIRPDGILSFKWGVPEIIREFEVKPFPFMDDDGAFGHPDVFEFILNRRIDVEGNEQLSMSTLTWVANWIREVSITGIGPGPFGTSHPQFPPPPAEPPGLDATQWGEDTFIAPRIRHVNPGGWDSFVMRWEVGNFNDRLRVFPALYYVTPGPWDSMQFGMPTIEDQTKAIRPGGIAPPWMTVPVPAVTRFSNVSLAGHGWLSEAWGDTWALPVVDGQVVVRGDDNAAFGLAGLSGTITPAGILGYVGHPVIGPHAVPAGWDDAQYGSPVILTFGCGMQARAMDGWDSAQTGTPAIGHAA